MGTARACLWCLANAAAASTPMLQLEKPWERSCCYGPMRTDGTWGPYDWMADAEWYLGVSAAADR